MNGMMKRFFTGVAASAMLVVMTAPALAEPQVNVKAGKFVTAKEKGAVKSFKMKQGYKGDAAARELGNKLYRAAKSNASLTLKDDPKSNKQIHVDKTDPAGHFRIDKTTGDFSFHKGFKEYINDRASAGLPTKEKAPDLAKKYLADLGLLPEKQDELVVRHVGGVNQVDVKDDKPTAELKKLVTVHFGRKIDGVDVGGPGSKMIVDLGENGELVAIQRRWVEVVEEQKTDADVRGQAEVSNEVKAKVRGEASKAKRADTTAPDFGYFDDGNGNIEPAYFFDAELTYDGVDPTGKPTTMKEKFHGVVPALKNSKADFRQLAKAEKPPGRAAQPTGEDKPSRKD